MSERTLLRRVMIGRKSAKQSLSFPPLSRLGPATQGSSALIEDGIDTSCMILTSAIGSTLAGCHRAIQGSKPA